MIEGLGFVRLEVRDLERSLAFYRRGLRFALADIAGARPDTRSDMQSAARRNGAVRLAAGTLRLELVEVPDRDATSCGVFLTIRVRGLDAYHDALVARGLAPSPPRDGEDVRAFTLRDPDGYELRFEQSLG